MIYDVKANGVLVFVPKYAMMGTIYFRDKDGHLLIPENALEQRGESAVAAPVRVSGFTTDLEKVKKELFFPCLGCKRARATMGCVCGCM